VTLVEIVAAVLGAEAQFRSTPAQGVRVLSGLGSAGRKFADQIKGVAPRAFRATGVEAFKVSNVDLQVLALSDRATAKIPARTAASRRRGLSYVYVFSFGKKGASPARLTPAGGRARRLRYNEIAFFPASRAAAVSIDTIASKQFGDHVFVIEGIVS
jgi:hypothetical protein